MAARVAAARDWQAARGQSIPNARLELAELERLGIAPDARESARARRRIGPPERPPPGARAAPGALGRRPRGRRGRGARACRRGARPDPARSGAGLTPPPVRLLERGSAEWPPPLAHLGAAEPKRLYVRGPLVARRPPAPDRRSRWWAPARPRRPGSASRARWPASWPRPASRSSAASRSASTRQRTRARSTARGRTIAVLGCGIDRDYPRRNAALAKRIASAGAIVSEWGPGVEPAPWRFPVRNRIVAALAQATVVVEATRRSGALITADHALALGRDVLAVPGAPWLDLGGGTLALLRAGAAPVGGASDVLDALGVQMEVEPASRRAPDGRGRRALGRAPPPPAPPRRAGAGSRPRRGRRKRRTRRAGTRRPDRRGARRNPVGTRAVPTASGKLVGPRGVAQLVERRSPKPKVAGSSPVAPVPHHQAESLQTAAESVG